MTAETRHQNEEKLTSARGTSADTTSAANPNVTRLTVKGLGK